MTDNLKVESFDIYVFILRSIEQDNLEGVKLGLSLINYDVNDLIMFDFKAYTYKKKEIKSFIREVAMNKDWFHIILLNELV